MSNIEGAPLVQEGAKVPEPVEPKQATSLRLWPALILFVLLVATRLSILVLDQLPPALFPVVFFGPLVATLLTALWWLFASRSQMRDRWLGFLILVVAGGASFWFSDHTMQTVAYMFFTLPVAVAVFLLSLFLLAGFGRGVATWGAVTTAVAVFGAATLVRVDGFTGDFSASFDWRWNPSAEDQFLAERMANKEKAYDKTERVAPAIGAVQWSEFRGPKRDNVVPGVRLEENWGATPPKELWRRKVGPGWSSFAATTDFVYTQEQRGDAEAVVCYDSRTGSEVWSYTYPSRFWESIAGAGPRATPTLHEGALFALGAEGILCRLDARTGKMAWTRDLRKDADRKPPMWGFASSPLVVHGLVVVHAGGAKDMGILAYDEKTGEPRWQAPSGDHTYSSPQLATVLGQPCILMLTNDGLAGYDPDTGKLLWNHDWKFENWRAVQPLAIGETALLLGTGLGGGTRRIDLKRDKAAVDTTERWTSKGMKAGFNDFVAHRGHLFGFDSTIFACLDLETGATKWRGGRYGNGQVLLLPDADQLLILSEKGDLVLLRANPDRLEELTRIKALSGKTWNHPVLAGNRLYVRNGEEAACYEVKNLAVQ